MLLLPVMAFWGAAHTAAFVLCQVRVMLAGKSAPAFASSLNISVCNLGIALGAAGGGWIVDRYGIEAIGFGSAVLAAASFVLAILMREGPKRHPLTPFCKDVLDADAHMAARPWRARRIFTLSSTVRLV